ncbi:anti-sigma F factor antagonist [Tepiditoga spiralis]|uniref:Anti-sigma factor antagonist n=1 Tax=Tepiditoga spiralis TaxID=2108365 RepID=A0A7G1G559_9BACT|nr:STAS domain-containing protein [Tepiditoga spiralis]BBE31700.1 anti-sigma F factor antagonist [Tepiditoga spiralis]
MEIVLNEVEGKKIIKISGEIDMSNIKEVKEKILDLKLSEMILDFKDVSYLDSSGIGMLISLHKTAQLKSGSLEIINIEEKIRKLFEMVGLDKILNIK